MEWSGISGFGGIKLARIIYGLSYGKPEVLSIDPTMTIDIVSSVVTSIQADGIDYRVVKHIHSSLILFHRGTHVFIVEGPDTHLQILKDLWVLADHGLSKTAVLKKICSIVSEDSSARGKKFQQVYARFIVGEDIGASTRVRRGYMAHQPPARDHRHVINGLVGNPLTSFRSREEFVKVLLDCIECKSGL